MSRDGKDDAKPSPVNLEKVAMTSSNREASIDGLGEEVYNLAEATAGLTSEIRMVDYRRKQDKRRTIALFTMLGLIMIAVGVGVGFLLHFANTNKELLTNVKASQVTNQKVLDEIKSCTDPKGDCAQAGAQSQAAAVGDINRITIYAAACAAQNAENPSVSVIQHCVEENLREDGLLRQ